MWWIAAALAALLLFRDRQGAALSPMQGSLSPLAGLFGTSRATPSQSLTKLAAKPFGILDPHASSARNVSANLATQNATATGPAPASSVGVRPVVVAAPAPSSPYVPPAAPYVPTASGGPVAYAPYVAVSDAPAAPALPATGTPVASSGPEPSGGGHDFV